LKIQRKRFPMTSNLRAETVHFDSYDGKSVEAYVALTESDDKVGGVVLIHHMPGYDEASKEMVRKFAANGYDSVCVNLYHRQAPDVSSDDAAAAVRALGGVTDEQLVGFCSGGRQSVLAACSLDLDAAVDCYGAFVVESRPESTMTSLVDILPDLSCPLLGLFGLEDEYPSPDQTETLRQLLTKGGKEFTFHEYEGAGHGFFAVDRPSYRPEVATEAWGEIWKFYAQHLSGKK
jgi:carboxymethylenebutenolidase